MTTFPIQTLSYFSIPRHSFQYSRTILQRDFAGRSIELVKIWQVRFSMNSNLSYPPSNLGRNTYVLPLALKLQVTLTLHVAD